MQQSLAPLPFAATACGGGGSLDRLLLALAAEFHPVDSAAALERLDELSRPLFGVARPDAHATAQRIAATLWVEGGVRPSGAFDGLYIDRVVADRRGDPALLAALYVEAARRAGVSLCLLSSGERWLLGLVDGYRIITIDPASPANVRPCRDPLGLRGHYAHELTDAVLCDLSGRFRSLGRAPEARRALELRLCLPLREPILARARADLRALEDAQ